MEGPRIDTAAAPAGLDVPRVLLIDPDQHTRAAFVTALAAGGCQVVAALRTGLTAVYAVRQHRPTVIVLDLDLRPAGVWGGLALAAALCKEAPAVPVLALVRSELTELAELAERATRAGARRLLPKEDVDGLVTAVHAEHAAQVQAASLQGGSRAGMPGVGGR